MSYNENICSLVLAVDGNDASGEAVGLDTTVRRKARGARHAAAAVAAGG